jgi:3-hydroxyisobutyrate dehydrogenase-like beta-hydroxyacid dehydrogenase
MGVALATQLRRERPILWASSGRSTATSERAERAGLHDVAKVEELARSSDVILSICPPHAAFEVAGSVAGFGFTGVYVDANAVSPQLAREMARVIEEQGGHYVDGGIVGPPPKAGVPTRLYLSGPMAPVVAGLCRDTVVQARIVSDQAGSASAVKMAYAAWSKGGRCPVARDPGSCSCRGHRGHAARRVARVRPRAARAISPGGAFGRLEGMAIRG